MREVFYPTLVLGVGPAGKRSLEFLDDMLVDIPEYFRDLIDLYEVGNVFECYKDIQNVIDEKLLSASRLNKLVDLGYTIRTESISNVKINIYVYWDVYNCNYSFLEFIKGIFNINYGGMDKGKHSGVAVYIIPMLDKEWMYNKEYILECINVLEDVIKYISSDENIINKDSKVLLAHSISKDGTRISMEELEYVCAIVSYLNILPSADPPLATFNKRMLRHEVNYKVGTIGISTLTVFKEKLIEDFKIHLVEDMLDRVISYEEDVDYSMCGSDIIYDIRVLEKDLKADMGIVNDNEYKIDSEYEYLEDITLKSILNNEIDDYPQVLREWKLRVNEKSIDEVKCKIDEKVDKILSDAEFDIDKHTKAIVGKYSLKQGREYLEFRLSNILDNSIESTDRIEDGSEEIMSMIEEKVAGYKNLVGFSVKIGLLTLIMIYSLINIISILSFIDGKERIVYICIIVLGLLLGIGIISLEYLYYDKALQRLVENYSNEINRMRYVEINRYIDKRLTDYKRKLVGYIDEKLNVVNRCILNCEDMRSEVHKNLVSDYNFENLVTELLNREDRENFYNQNKRDINHIYFEFINEIGDFCVLREEWILEVINEFAQIISCTCVNVDFSEFVKSKWGEDAEEHIKLWLKKGGVKAKELLQYNEKGNLEVNKIFIGSKEFIDSFKGTLRKELDKFKLISMQGEEVCINCISIVKIVFGIDIDDVNPFANARGGYGE